MWGIIDGVSSSFRWPARRQARPNMLPAVLIGAGVGIATWEVVKRRMAHTAVEE